MEPPVKYIFHGDRQRCEALRGQAKRVSLILDNIMSSGRLKQHSIKLVPYPGALIVASKFFGTRIVDIYIGLPQEEEKVIEKRCLCNCNFSTGYIFEIQPETIDVAQLYTVMACVGTTRYALFKNILASDFTAYELYQKVILIPYNQMRYLCCTADRTGSSRGCSPIVSQVATSEDNWRTTYRIIPWCALRVPKWVAKR